MADHYPSEIANELNGLTVSVDNSIKALHPLIETTRADLIRDADTLQTIKIDLTTAFAANSLFWVYLASQGLNPKDHPVKQELDRIRAQMNKVKQFEDKKKAPRLEMNAAKRFINHSLYDRKSKKPRLEAEEPTSGGTTASSSAGGDVIVIEDDSDAVIMVDDSPPTTPQVAHSSKHSKANKKKKSKKSHRS